MSGIHSYRDLLVWQKAMLFVRQVYELTQSLPREEQFGLTPQLRRSAVSVPSNIAEGSGRGSTADYVRFLYMARGSLFESQTQLELSVELNFLQKQQLLPVLAIANEIERMLNALISKLSS